MAIIIWLALAFGWDNELLLLCRCVWDGGLRLGFMSEGRSSLALDLACQIRDCA
jgi:hypothetical protein